MGVFGYLIRFAIVIVVILLVWSILVPFLGGS